MEEYQCWSPEIARRIADNIHAEVKDMVANSRLVRKGEGLALVNRGDIHVKRLLGKGAFSEVHEVKVNGMDSETESKTYAMKHLKGKLMGQQENFRLAAAELAVEAHMLASFDHPNILKIRGWAANGVASFLTGRHDSFFLLLDTLDLTLDQQIAKWQKQQARWMTTPPQENAYNNIVVDFWRRWNLTSGEREANARHEEQSRLMQLEKDRLLEEKLRISYEIAAALAYLHEQGVIFRDLKPNNLGLINGRIQLFDFGLSRELPNGRDLVKPYEMSGKVGTLRYMAVEVASHQAYNVSADVYSWAMVCYEVLTLKKPFAGWTRDMHADMVCRRGARPELKVENRVTEQAIPLRMKSLLETSWHQEAYRRPTMKMVCQKLSMQLSEQVLAVQALKEQINQQKAVAMSTEYANRPATKGDGLLVEFPSDFGEVRKAPGRNTSEMTSSTVMSTDSWAEGPEGIMAWNAEETR